MITSGYLIGQIIDEFSAVGEQAKLRNRLGLSDLSVFSENFFCDILNIVEKLDLVNTNEDRANEPGVDLGDEKEKIAYQVTSTKTSEKIKNTLKKITFVQRKKYNRFVVLIIGEKQGQYDAVVNALRDRSTSEIDPSITFNPDTDIVDLTDLARKVVGLPFSDIQRLHRLVQDQMGLVKIDLQVPDTDGQYETSGYKLWEPLPIPKLGDGTKFAAWEAQFRGAEYVLTKDDTRAAREAIEELSGRLHKLPRITREFFAMLHERADKNNLRFTDHRSLFIDSVYKTYPSAEIELSLLIAQNLLDIDRDPLPFREYIPGEIGLRMGLGDDGFRLGFYDFVVEEKLSFRRILGDLDFSGF
ncbi:hypothetical protein ALQ33_01991 [Pseudomonas syringae pv. philadelphi]|uniref:SMEK domain-containing protein n=1 Tax=Pseudomonas syringae pv. philadelphi TaxID=251706 RepID=A0A3M3YD39_9PSED|nr:SMEK domain-containing protein [Pseudomonas syringae group genomosp. 3]RMO80029.1 hypothetical protein ALQ33_01991 [Pseudomonas syringae pv. philadelphi]